MKQADSGGEVAVLALFVDSRDEVSGFNLSRCRNFLERLPECIFESNAGLASGMVIDLLKTRDRFCGGLWCAPARGVFDGTTRDPIQKAIRDAMIAFMAATAEAQAEATKEAQRAGIALAKASDQAAYRGRKPSFTRGQLALARDMLGRDAGVSAIAKEIGLSRQTIYRIEADPVGAEAVLARWS
jgi:hypothetical protein